MTRRGIILAGGAGTRLHPVTRAVSKQLLPVYDKPMVYYPLATLMQAGIQDILLVSTRRDLPGFERLLGDGSQWGISIRYAVQDEPRGIAEAFLIGEEFLKGGPSALILGDNLFHGEGLDELLVLASARTQGATVFPYRVRDPERYGVLVLDEGGRPERILEKPDPAPSSLAVTGLYFYDGRVSDVARNLAPSARGELEITDVNNWYLRDGSLSATVLGRGVAWLDTGTHSALLQASNYIQAIEERQGLKVALPGEVAWRAGFISDDRLAELAASSLEGREHSSYLRRLLTIGRGR